MKNSFATSAFASNKFCVFIPTGKIAKINGSEIISGFTVQYKLYLCYIYIYSDDTDTTTPCHTPDSYMSNGSYSNLSELSRLSSLSNFRIPEKLQIVKPLEGQTFCVI